MRGENDLKKIENERIIRTIYGLQSMGKQDLF